MITLPDTAGKPCARLDVLPLGGGTWALALEWGAESPGRADRAAWIDGFSAQIEACRGRGARGFATRVITSQSDLEPSLVAARSEMQRSILETLRFSRGEGRIEYRLSLDDAIAALESGARPDRLTWVTVPCEPGPGMERAARVLAEAAQGDPESDPADDVLGFLLARLEDRSLALLPESQQIGLLAGTEAVVLVASVRPATGWCSHYYLAVVPACRRQGLAEEAMRHGFRVMRELGGRTYHDGTSARNAGALALLNRLGPPPWRVMEEWRLAL